MVRAAVSGALNFDRADPFDTWWWIKTNLVLEEVSRQDRVVWLSANHRHWCAMMAHGNLKDDGFAKSQTESSALLDKVADSLFPWREKTQGPQDLMQMWISEFGNPDSPETQAMIDAACAAIAAVPVNTDEAEE